jgi:hypothetical protein
MDLQKYSESLENSNNAQSLLEYAKINFNSKTGVILLSKKNDDNSYTSVEVPKNKRVSLYLVDCSTTFTTKENEVKNITIKAQDEVKNGFKIQFRNENKIFDFYKDFEKLWIKKMLNQLLNCDLSKKVTFIFAFDKTTQKPFLLVQQKDENNQIINIKGKYSKEEMPIAEEMKAKSGKITYDFTDIYKYIEDILIEELKVKIQKERRVDWSEYSHDIVDIPLEEAEEAEENPVLMSVEDEDGVIYNYDEENLKF